MNKYPVYLFLLCTASPLPSFAGIDGIGGTDIQGEGDGLGGTGKQADQQRPETPGTPDSFDIPELERPDFERPENSAAGDGVDLGHEIPEPADPDPGMPADN